MKQLAILFLFSLIGLITQAQAPQLVKAVAGTATEPYAKDQEGWKSNEWNGKFFYRGTGTPMKLCVTDGTSAGTQFIADLPGSSLKACIPAQDFMYIIASNFTTSPAFTTTDYIYKSDGTAAGTSLVYTMPAITGFSVANVWTSDRDLVKNYSVAGNTMYFAGYDASSGSELWVTDGTPGGTHMVKDIKSGTGNSGPYAFCRLGIDVFFTAAAVGAERKLWKTDGTNAGTVQVPVPEPFFVLDNAVGLIKDKMIFYAYNTVDGYEPYVSDGTAAGTFMLANINPSGNSWLAQSQNAHLRSNSKYAFFIAFNGTANALWRTDGTSAGTIQLTTNSQAVSSGVSGGSYTDIDESAFWMIEYNSSGSGNNEKLYRSDGTVAGTWLVASNLSYAQYLKIYKQGLWMQSRNTGSAANVEPWRSGGNAATTNKAFEIEPGTAAISPFTPISSNPYGFFVKDNKLFFFASRSSPAGHNLYQYTGDFTFNGSQAGGRWSDSTNWNGLMPPGLVDSVFVNAGTPNSLSVTGANAYAGTLITTSNVSINLAASTDSLIISTRLNTGTGNNFTGAGLLSLNSMKGDTVQLSGGFAAANLAIQSTANLVTNNIRISDKINLVNNAQLLLNNNDLILTGSTAQATQAGTSRVNTNGTGKMTIEHIGAAGRTGAVLFPVGSTSAYNPVTLTNAGTSDHFSVRVTPQLFQDYAGENGNNPYSSNAVGNTWFISEAVAGGSNATVSLQWNAAQELPGFNRAASQFGHYSSGAWQTGVAGAAAGADPYTFTGSGVTSFSPFGILNNAAVLPLRFLSFTAQPCSSGQVCLAWSTENEQGVAHFEIERSTDGRSFFSLHKQAARNQVSNTYTATDDIASLAAGKIFYRIKEVDQDGKTAYSKLVMVRINNTTVILTSNLVSSSLPVQNLGSVALQLQLRSGDGKILRQYRLAPGNSTLHLADLPAGVYYYTILSGDGITQQGRLVKQ